MYNLSKVFKIEEVTNKQVIVNVSAKDPLTVARYPFLNSKMKYITVTRGDNHICTVIKEDGTTWSWEFGSRGHTLISDSVFELQKNLLEFIRSHDIAIDYAGGFPKSARIFYNGNYNKWQLTIDVQGGQKSDFHVWATSADSIETAIKAFKGFVTSDNWNLRSAVTGLRVWDAVNPTFTLK